MSVVSTFSGFFYTGGSECRAGRPFLLSGVPLECIQTRARHLLGRGGSAGSRGLLRRNPAQDVHDRLQLPPDGLCVPSDRVHPRKRTLRSTSGGGGRRVSMLEGMDLDRWKGVHPLEET